MNQRLPSHSAGLRARSLVLAAATFGAVLAACTAATEPAEARDTVRIVGSSTVFPFSTTAAEQFGARGQFATPVVEQTGTGGGIALFCGGVGAGTPDIANASRRMKAGEFELCQTNGVTDIVEVKIGYDGIVLANVKTGPVFDLSLRDIFLALAAEIPKSDTDCTLVTNPHANWSDVDPTLPPIAIEVFGPPPTSGTRDAFVEIAMEQGARSFACLAALEQSDASAFRGVAHKIREDGVWIDAGENDNSIVQTIAKNANAVGVFGYSFLEQNSDRLRGAAIDDSEPSFDNIASGDYRVARSMYIYVKAQHIGVIPGLQEFAAEMISEAAAGSFGYMTDKGLIPLDDDSRAAMEERVRKRTLLTAEEL